MEKSNIFDIISLPKKLLEVTGCWPKRHKTTFYKLRQIMSWVVDMTLLTTMLMELVLNIKEKDYKHLTEMISLLASGASYYSKHVIFLLKTNKFLDLLDELKKPVFSNYPMQADRHVRKLIKYVTLVMKIYQTLIMLIILMYFLKPFLTSEKMALRFEMYDVGRWWFLMHTFQVYSLWSGCWNNSTLDTTALALISIGSAQFQILRDKLLFIRKWARFSYEEVSSGSCGDGEVLDDIDEYVKVRLKDCVEHHYAIIRYADELEIIYSYYFFAQFTNSVLAICNTWFQLQTTNDILSQLFFTLYSVVLVTQLGIYCYFGNNLTTASENIREACYMSDWYNCGNSVQKYFQLIMERSKRSSVLTAGKFSVLGLTTFSTLLRSSYSFFALMNNLQEES